MTDTAVYNVKGEKVDSVKLPESIFGLPWNESLVSSVAFAMLENARSTIASTKGRGDVRGGGRKPWRQKGTGRARHGSTRSPIWVGGGVAHGPNKEKVYGGKINKKARVKALLVALSKKAKDGELLLVDSLPTLGKTKAAALALQSLSKVSGFEKIGYKKGNRAMFVCGAKDADTDRAFGNIQSVAIEEARSLSALDVLSSQYLVMVSPTQVLSVIEKRASAAKSGQAKE